MLKPRELRVLDEDELEQKLRELKETLFNLRFQHATGQLDNPMKIKEARRDIARVCTIMTERRYAIHPEAFEEALASPFEFEEEPEGEPEEPRDLEEPEEMPQMESEEELALDAVEGEFEGDESEELLEEEVDEELRDL